MNCSVEIKINIPKEFINEYDCQKIEDNCCVWANEIKKSLTESYPGITIDVINTDGFEIM